MRVLSLFDGISCGRVALERANITVDEYIAYEISPKPIQISKKNYPDIKHCGDVATADFTQYNGFDLLIGGSPCQDLSVYKFDRGDVKGLEGKKSSLFFHFERALNEVKPKYFLLENVPMQQGWEDIITQLLGVEPIMINSNLVCGADRKRLYWTNIPNVTQPEDKGIMLKDIVQESFFVDDKYWYDDKDFIFNGDDKKVQATLDIKGHRNMKEVYNLKGKCNTLLADGDGGHRVKKVFQDGVCRKLTPLEYERLQTLPDNYTAGVSDSARYSAIGNGWTVDVVAHILKNIN